MKFAAHLATMFQEHNYILARYEAAAKAGFKYVETALNTYTCDAAALKEQKEKYGLVQASMTTPGGKETREDKGYACLPDQIGSFRESLETAITYAKSLSCDKVHVMAGKKSPDFSHDEMKKCYKDNIEYAAQRLARERITCLIEPINSTTVPQYFLNSFDQAAEYLQIPNVRLQLDIFHMQIICGNLTANIRKYLPYTGHIQIAQVPDRGEPDSAGEINYEYVLNLLENCSYAGYVGCEYIPQRSTMDGLNWFHRYQKTNE